MPMPFIGDFVGGFQGRSSELRTEELGKAERQAAREGKIFELLANSDDDEIRAAAVTGLLSGENKKLGLDKWFQTASGNPIFEQIKGLVGQGKQPFMGVEDRTAAGTRGTIKGRVSGAAEAYNETAGQWPDQDLTERIVMGASGAAQRGEQRRYGTAVVDDPNNPGQTMQLGASAIGGVYYGDDGEQLTGVRQFVASGNVVQPNTTRGSITKDLLDQQGKRWSVTYNAQGDEIRRVPHDPVGPPPSFSPVITPQGVQGFNNRTNTLAPTSGGQGMGRAEDPAQAFNSIKTLVDQVEQAASRDVQLPFAGIRAAGNDPKVKVALDRNAQMVGRASYAALMEELGQAQRGVSSAVPQPGAPPAAPGQPAAPGAPPAPRTGGTTSTSGLNVQGILEALRNNRAKQQTPQASPPERQPPPPQRP